MEEAKIMRFVESFVNAVGIMPGGLKFDSGSTVLPESRHYAELDVPVSPGLHLEPRMLLSGEHSPSA